MIKNVVENEGMLDQEAVNKQKEGLESGIMGAQIIAAHLQALLKS